jgi:hypothetical protein
MQSMYYNGIDVRKKTISYCVKDGSRLIPATRLDLHMWMKTLLQPWTAAMEATIFTAWIYDHLLPHAATVKVAQAPPLPHRSRSPSYPRPDSQRHPMILSVLAIRKLSRNGELGNDAMR